MNPNSEKIKSQLHIVPRDKKLLKSSKIRKCFKCMEAVIEHQMIKQDAMSKMQEAIILGVPLIMYDDGRIEVVKDFYSKR